MPKAPMDQQADEPNVSGGGNPRAADQ